MNQVGTFSTYREKMAESEHRVDLTNFDSTNECADVKTAHEHMRGTIGRWKRIESYIVTLILTGPPKDLKDRLARIMLLDLRKDCMVLLSEILMALSTMPLSTQNLKVLAKATSDLVETMEKHAEACRLCDSYN